MKNSFLQEGYQQAEYEKAIFAYLKTEKQGVTLQDVVLNTALKTEWTEYTLRQMLGKFPAHLEINQKQELVYLFDLTPKPLPIGKYIWQGIGWVFWLIWQVFTIAFKIWTVGMLLTYAVVYALVLVIAITAITRSGEVLEMVFHGFISGVGELWNMLTGKSKTSVNENDRRFLSDIFSYIFGATPPKKDKLATEKLILQQIRAQAGKLVPADIVRLTGWALLDAQTQAAYLLANYQGEVNVTQEGKIEYFFPELIKENSENTLPAPIWKQDPEMPKMNNLDSEMHSIVTGLNIFNMVMAIASPFILFLVFPDLNTGSAPPEWVMIWLVMVPFAFSFIFLGIPLCRYPFVLAQRAKIKTIQKRHLILGKIFEFIPKPIVLDLYAQTLAYAIQDSKEKATAIFEHLQAEMRADVEATAEGTAYHFKDLA